MNEGQEMEEQFVLFRNAKNQQMNEFRELF